MIPCKGIFADVVRKVDFKPVEERRNLKNIIASYEDYKRGYAQITGDTNDIGGKKGSQ